MPLKDECWSMLANWPEALGEGGEGDMWSRCGQLETMILGSR